MSIKRKWKTKVQFRKDLKCIRKQIKTQNDFSITKLYPVLEDKKKDSGLIQGHYFYQDLHIAQRIFTNHPQKHIDIGSRIDGIVAHVASFRNIEVFDIRPLTYPIENIVFKQVDFTRDDLDLDNYCDSISFYMPLNILDLEDMAMQ